jgi:hypothetical protein
MKRDSRKTVGDGSRRFDADTIEREIRERIRTTIEVIVEEELEVVLGAKASERVGGVRRSFRHAHAGLLLRLRPTSAACAAARQLIQSADASADAHKWIHR